FGPGSRQTVPAPTRRVCVNCPTIVDVPGDAAAMKTLYASRSVQVLPLAELVTASWTCRSWSPFSNVVVVRIRSTVTAIGKAQVSSSTNESDLTLVSRVGAVAAAVPVTVSAVRTAASRIRAFDIRVLLSVGGSNLAGSGRRAVDIGSTSEPKAMQTQISLLGVVEATLEGRPVELGYPVLRQEADRVGEVRIGAVEEHIGARLAAGRADAVVGDLQALLAAHPLPERLISQLMLALYGAGRQAEALETYRAARRRL